jgi:hypothetical protein
MGTLLFDEDIGSFITRQKLFSDYHIFHFIMITLPMPYQFEEGEVLLIDKPYRWTSFDAVRKIRNTIKIKK